LLGKALNNQGKVLRARGNLPESHQCLEEAITLQQHILEWDPKNPARVDLHNHYGSLAQTFVSLGEHVAAPQAVLKMSQVLPENVDSYLRAADLLVPCGALAEKDPNLAVAERQRRAEDDAQQAVGQLRQAIERGYMDEKALATDADFTPLRARFDFQELLRELQEKGKRSSC
jgi:tetratricopeptide (TPR) repeat protein